MAALLYCRSNCCLTERNRNEAGVVILSSGSHTQNNQPSGGFGKKAVELLVLVVLVAVLGVVVNKLRTAEPATFTPHPTAAPTQTAAPATPGPKETAVQPTDTPEQPPEETPQIVLPTPVPEFHPTHTDNTDPADYVKQLAVNVDGKTLAEDEVYSPEEQIDFMPGDEYTALEGVITFRGNNFRDTAAYGYANLKNYKFGTYWFYNTGALTAPDGETWTGSGWVGQPLIVKWPKETKAIMNMYDWAKDDDALVEVIYATMDGNIYFLDLATGKQTRDTLHMGYTFKGAGALDPRGYPLLYVGAGYNSSNGNCRAFIISLIDFKVLHSFGPGDTGGFALRAWPMFDGSPLVDAETDQLIYPGENGIVYIIKLNTEYDIQAGTISIDPVTTKWHYNGRNTTLGQYWVGMEDSPAIWRGHMIIADNGGRLLCLDLNTLELDWVQNIWDDSNGTPVISIENGHPYVYVGTSFHLGWRSWTTANVPLFKIDAENGEIVWKKEYNCHSESGLSGGIQSTIALGKNDLEGYVYVTVSKTDAYSNGVLACIDRETGEVVWEHHSYYTWSSPVLIYNEDGSGCVLYCNYGRNMFLLDGKTGKVHDTFDLAGGVEASPAVYENTVVIGTRACRIWGVKIT